MKVAITHDILVEYGGAERVLQSLLHIYPEAHIYTAYLEESVLDKFSPPLLRKNIHVIPTKRFGLEPISYLFQPLSPLFWKSLQLEAYDIVISNSAFFLCNTINVWHPLHIQYVLCPPKNIFDLVSKTPMQKIINYAPFLARHYVGALRRYPYVIADSKHIQSLLRRISGVSATVIYPPVQVPRSYHRSKHRDYYLIVSRIDEQKDIEIAIEACSRLRVPLKIVGSASDGNYIPKLRKIAGPTIEFLGFLEDTKIYHLYERAIAFLFTPKSEDFGIAPVEAMAHGVPVIAYHGGGVKETVADGITGKFYYTHSTEALMRVIRQFDSMRYSPSVLHAAAQTYSVSSFENHLRQYVQKNYEIFSNR